MFKSLLDGASKMHTILNPEAQFSSRSSFKEYLKRNSEVKLPFKLRKEDIHLNPRMEKGFTPVSMEDLEKYLGFVLHKNGLKILKTTQGNLQLVGLNNKPIFDGQKMLTTNPSSRFDSKRDKDVTFEFFSPYLNLSSGKFSDNVIVAKANCGEQSSVWDLSSYYILVIKNGHCLRLQCFVSDCPL
jgi:hypothetical protein